MTVNPAIVTHKGAEEGTVSPQERPRSGKLEQGLGTAQHDSEPGLQARCQILAPTHAWPCMAF